MHRTIKSFVLRKGRMSQRQHYALEHWLQDYQLDLSDTPWDLNLLFGADKPIVVEIGFGMGHSLANMAKTNPNIHYIGIEVHQAGLGSLSADLHDQQLTNISIVPFDAVTVFEKVIPDNSLQGIQIFFPDPWPKKRHHKRRLVQTPFVNLLVSKLKPRGFIHIATDWEEYAEHILDVLSAHPELSNTATPHHFSPRPETRPLTKFEARGQHLGHGTWDMIFYRKT